MSKSIKEKREDRSPHQWQPVAEAAPSVMKEDEPSTARVFGMIGASLVLFGAMTLVLRDVFKMPVYLDTALLYMVIALGLVGLLSHAVFDPDLQVRRLYWGGGFLLLAAFGGLGYAKVFGFGVGLAGQVLGLFFLLAVLRHETNATIRESTTNIIGAIGLIKALVALVFGNNFSGEFLVPYGIGIALVGLAFLSAYVSLTRTSTDRGYMAALGIGGLGVAAILNGVLRAVITPLVSTTAPNYMFPWGLMYVGIGLMYLLVSVGYCSDSRLVVLVKREMSSFFFSPIAYIVLFGMVFFTWLQYNQFLIRITAPPRGVGDFVFEPILQEYMQSGLAVFFSMVFIVPVLTMRTFSEEWRTGTLEVALTAPVDERTIVLSKFLACLLQFLLLWVPWVCFLLVLRVWGGQPFDYRPALSFSIALIFTGAGFVAMGVFFSSLTSNQIIAAVLTFAGMLVMTFLIFVPAFAPPDSVWVPIASHASYIDLWFESLKGALVPRYLLFHASLAVFWLFLTVKVLESRKWS